MVNMYYNKKGKKGEVSVLPSSVSEMKEKGWTTTAPKKTAAKPASKEA